jgi:hypothetical protein
MMSLPEMHATSETLPGPKGRVQQCALDLDAVFPQALGHQ